MNDPVAERLKSLRRLTHQPEPVKVPVGDLEWLLERHDWAVKALKVQQELGNEYYENGRKLGYDLGRAEGYDEAVRDGHGPEQH